MLSTIQELEMIPIKTSASFSQSAFLHRTQNLEQLFRRLIENFQTQIEQKKLYILSELACSLIPRKEEPMPLRKQVFNTARKVQERVDLEALLLRKEEWEEYSTTHSSDFLTQVSIYKESLQWQSEERLFIHHYPTLLEALLIPLDHDHRQVCLFVISSTLNKHVCL